MTIGFKDNIEVLQRKVVEDEEISRKLRMSATRTDDVTGSTISKEVIKWVTGDNTPAIESMAVELGDMILADLPENKAEALVVCAYKTNLHAYLSERSDLQ